MKFLVLVQDLRVVGSSAGVGRRSFLAKLRKAYPNAEIDVQYFILKDTEDHLDLLPVNNIVKNIVNTKRPGYITFLNRFYWRLLHESLNERYVQNQYAKIIANINYEKYDHILVTSSGLEHETILATHNLPILRKAILVFHDPYPLAWYVGYNKKPSKLDLFRLKRMIEVVNQAKTCATTANYMSHDLQNLYASKKKFYTLPHQFDVSVFNLSDTEQVVKKSKKISISYSGALMFGRNPENMLQAYGSLLSDNSNYKEQTEFVLRVKGDGAKQLMDKYKDHENIKIYDTLDFSNSYNEQVYERDILVILENGPVYCNILVGKASFIASCNKPVLCISPEKSELRSVISDKKYVANMNDVSEIKSKLKELIDARLKSNEPVYPFGNYFSDKNFKLMLDSILYD
ncbi:hypothetical protein [Seonamhaeicola sp. ML3]|uniref:hypothetical protein n=1 Tax=Seonamhaeicola sp. ML3 TaxID=2937786 RepID=UPI00200CFBDB|nr:hypothetical protein [Seonamhaeicola sp. ML3]